MKKILLVFDGTNFSEGAFEFAKRLNQLNPILIAGVFVPQTDIANLWSYADAVTSSIPLIEEEQSRVIESNVIKFEQLCKAVGIKCVVHKDIFNLALPELKKESTFADLIIIGSEIFYKEYGTSRPNLYLKDLLHDMHCPVLIVPEKFDFPESNILAYDGSNDALVAIKQFSALFPELNGNDTLLVYANEHTNHDIPDKELVQEYVSTHFKKSSFFKLDIDPKKYFATWIMDRQSPILVSGSYGRSGLSQMFKQSFISDVISIHKLPVFIAHN
jgi:hypothetical protein